MQNLDTRSKWAYSIGAVGRDMAYTLVSMFLLTYIQYTVQLSVAQFSAISIVMVLALVWDAINDLLMGMLIENSQLKYGKYKPWILAGAILNSVVIILLFSVRPTGWAFVAYFALIYIGWGMTYTMNDIAYYGMLPSLTSDPKKRNSLVTLMNIFVSIGQFSVAVIVPMLVAGNAIVAYRKIALAVALAFVIFQLITVLGVKERERRENQDKLTLNKMYQIFKNNDQLVYIGLAALFFYIGSGLLILFAMNFFYFEFGYGQSGGLITIFTVMYGLGTLLSQFAFSPLVDKLGRNKLIKIMVFSLVILYLLFLSLGYILAKSAVLIYIIGFAIFFFQGLGTLLMVVMINNTIEYDELKHGHRHESVISGVRSFAVKLATGINQLIVALVLIVSGIYSISQKISGLELEVGLAKMTSETALKQANLFIGQVTRGQTFLLRLGIVIFPIFSFIIMYQLIKKHYIIDEAMYLDILSQLDHRD